MTLLAMNTLYEKRAMMGTYGPKHTCLTLCATRTIIFQRENLNYLMVCFTQYTLFFQHICYLLPICLPWALSLENVCNKTL